MLARVCAPCQLAITRPSSYIHIACSSGGQRWRPQVVSTGRNEPFEDVQLGPLLGKGSYGRVYRAMWNSILVAVKVQTAVGLICCLSRLHRALQSGSSCTPAGFGPMGLRLLASGLQVIETPCDKGEDDEPVPLFEADKGAGLSHPNIVQTYKSSSTISKVHHRL